MASSKLSALAALTSVGNDDLVYVADTADGGSTYASKKVTKANLFSGYATETYVDTAVTNLIDGAPDALNTLNELAAALNDDASAAASLTTLINANETHIDNNVTLLGITKDDTDLGTFTGTTISDNVTVKAALQALETSVESKGSSASLTSLTTAVGDLNTLSGVAQNDEDLGTFTGSTIADSVTIKTALQTLETTVEDISAVDTDVVDAGDNVNRLVGVTSADSVPVDGSGDDNYLFLVVNKSTGAIAAIDKTFLEAEGQVDTAGVTFAFTPSYTFDGDYTDTSYETYSSGDDVYDDYGIEKIELSNSFISIHFSNSTDMSTWRGVDRSVVINYPSGTETWEGTFDLTSNEEYSVNTTYNYIHYDWTDMGLSIAEKEDLADAISSAGAGNSIINLTLS